MEDTVVPGPASFWLVPGQGLRYFRSVGHVGALPGLW